MTLLLYKYHESFYKNKEYSEIKDFSNNTLQIDYNIKINFDTTR